MSPYGRYYIFLMVKMFHCSSVHSQIHTIQNKGRVSTTISRATIKKNRAISTFLLLSKQAQIRDPKTYAKEGRYASAVSYLNTLEYDSR